MTSKLLHKVLIIDDNVDIHQDFINILTTKSKTNKIDSLAEGLFGDHNSHKDESLPVLNLQIDSAFQGQEGAERVAQSLIKDEPYALAFIDMRMPPGWDGIQTIKNIWQHDPDIQIVICTAYSDYSWEETVTALGMRDNLLILKKPFDTVSVRQIASALTTKWELARSSKEYTTSLEIHVQERTSSLQQSLSLISATLESSKDGIVVVSDEGNILNYNNNYINMWHIKSSIIGKRYHDVIREYVDTLTPSFGSIHSDLTSFNINDNKTHIVLNDSRRIEYYAQPCVKENVAFGVVWVFRDVTERILLNEKLEHQATHDALTGLPNRACMFDRLNQTILNAKRHNSSFCVLFFDLDRFKFINDSLGHRVGDEVLKAFVDNVKSLIRESDTFARIGGDEFVMIVPDFMNEESIVKFVLKILNKVKEPLQVFEHNLVMSSSIGISIYPKDGETSNEILVNADMAMYSAKQSGSAQFQFYDNQLNYKSMHNMEMASELRYALDNNQLIFYYQPQYNTVTNEIYALEALIRWQHPSRGLLLPADFLPVAEETGLIVDINEWALEKVCIQNKQWQNKGLTPVRVAVNLSTTHLRKPNFVETVKEILKRTNLNPCYLEIELTENSKFEDDIIISRIVDLRKLGVHIALDDFGTGNTSINCLLKLPLTNIKIDKSFVQNLNLEESSAVIIQAVIAIGKSLNLDIIAEGVETLDQLNFLIKNKCNNIQGFYFSKPLTVDDVEKVMQKSLIEDIHIKC